MPPDREAEWDERADVPVYLLKLRERERWECHPQHLPALHPTTTAQVIACLIVSPARI